jgi:hypothetical protein
MAGFIPKKLYKGCQHLDNPLSITFGSGEGEEPLDTYTKVTGVWENGESKCNQGFKLDGTGKITYTGEDGVYALFNNSSDLKVSHQAEIVYVLFKNGVLVPRTETPHTFTAVSKLSNISITNIIGLKRNDYFEVFVKSDSNTTLTINTLYLTFMGD